jgi:transcriptional regulator with XRE-family HTH domain
MERKRKTSKSLRSRDHLAVRAVIATTRKMAGLTQEQLSERLNWHRSTVAKIENGERRLDVPEFLSICRVLKADPETMIRRVVQWS